MLRTGCEWRAISKDLPPRETIFGYFDPILVAGHALAHAADVQDRDGGALVLPTLLKLYAGGGYQQPEINRVVKKALVQVNVERVKRSDQAKGFVVLPKRWIAERTFRCSSFTTIKRCLMGPLVHFPRTMPPSCQGLEMPRPQGARLPVPRHHSPHAAKAMQSRVMFSVRLLDEMICLG
jgi:transposase